jgi:hypothetical protein
MMGSLPKPPLMSESAICKMYLDGFSRVEIGYMARMYDRQILEILKRNGIAIRHTAEAMRLARLNRLRLRKAPASDQAKPRTKLRLAEGRCSERSPAAE